LLCTAVSAFIRSDPLMRCRVTWRCSFRSHNLKISTFLKNAHKSDILFSYCDQKQQISNI
ncbi:hypothetical protein E0I52_29785, partial [Escherichia coli]